MKSLRAAAASSLLTGQALASQQGLVLCPDESTLKISLLRAILLWLKAWLRRILTSASTQSSKLGRFLGILNSVRLLAIETRQATLSKVTCSKKRNLFDECFELEHNFGPNKDKLPAQTLHSCVLDLTFLSLVLFVF